MDPSMAGPDGNVRVQSRALAADGEVQSDNTVETSYNIRGIMNNSCEFINFKVKQ